MLLTRALQYRLGFSCPTQGLSLTGTGVLANIVTADNITASNVMVYGLNETVQTVWG